MNKVQIVDTALRVAGINWKKKGVELVLRIIEAVEEKGGELTIKEIFEIEHKIELIYDDKSQENE